MSVRQPVVFVSHGSPMTALGGDALSAVWEGLAKRLTRPAAIVVVSAHWESESPLFGGDAQPDTVHDFGGFPEALYRLQYPAPGAPALAERGRERLKAAGIAAGIDSRRGLDHGAWVPLRTLFPDADVPVVPLSVQPALGARHHYALGAALADLSAENVLILASGHVTHDLGQFFRNRGQGPTPEAQAFREWVHTRVMSGADEALFGWEAAPGARAAHPTPEHFLPLFVALGAAGAARHSEALGGGWVGGVLAADNYLFTAP